MAGAEQRMILGQAQAQGLLRVDVLAVAHRLQRVQYVPMVRRGDANGIQIRPSAQLAKVRVDRAAVVAIVSIHHGFGPGSLP